MSLRMIFAPGVGNPDLLTSWPEKPSLHRLPAASPLPGLFGRPTLDDFLDTGCIPPRHLNVLKEAVGLDPRQYVDQDRIIPDRLRRVRESAGCTLHIRHLEQWHPPAAAVVDALQRETGCTGYLSAFITPAHSQGLLWHWDQALGVIVQMEGAKRWELWQPKVTWPMRDHLSPMNPDVWRPEWVEQWKQAGPDVQYDLTPGDVLVLPRGWIHNPHSLHSDKESVHLTFVLRERTPQWVAEQLAALAVTDTRFRRAIPPAGFVGAGMRQAITETRQLLIDYLAGLDEEMAGELLWQTALTERDLDA
jgi:hypothetical protein